MRIARKGGLWMINSEQSRLRSFPILSSQRGLRSGPSCALTTLYPQNINVHCTCFFPMCRNVHANAHSLPSVVYWAWQSQWARSSHPLDKAETELDCLRTVDTCIRRTMILNCLSLPLNADTNKTLRASNAVAVGVNRDRALPSIITICCCSLSRVAVGARN